MSPARSPTRLHPPRDRLSENLVPLHPLSTFADRLLHAVTNIPPDREPFVVHDGLRGALVFGWTTDSARRLDKPQLAPVGRVIFTLLRRLPREVLSPTCDAALVLPMIDAMPMRELVVTAFATADLDPLDPTLHGACRRAVAAKLRARLS